ncbi:MAG TPA: hypothetical protein VE967_11435 [Gemmatimonadaceae bacterium]|nr:hypothetical protein [Gemmatimonadaceae bacterium]
MKEKKGVDVAIVIGMLLVFVIPALIALATIREPRLPVVVPQDPAHNPSPYGYTWSLGVYVVPVVVLGWWVFSMHRGAVEKKALWITVGLLIPAWTLLDVTLGLTFFKFPNTGASVGSFWGYTFDAGWKRIIPLEEIVFYTAGFISILLVYIWADEYWLSAYRKPRPTSSAEAKKLISFHPESAIFGVLLFGAVWAFKAWGPHPYHDGFPGYFLFMLLATILPSMMLFDIASPFINWRALTLAGFYIISTSLFWEASLALPYGWWDYQPRQMMGIFIGAWTNLPIEAATLWVFAAWTNIIVYESIHTFLRMDRRDVVDVLSAKPELPRL